MATAYVNKTIGTESSSTTSVSGAAPSGIADDDIMLAAIAVYDESSAPRGRTFDSTPAGWTEVGKNSGTYANTFHLYIKRCQSESGSYQWDWTGACRAKLVITAWRGDIDLIDPIAALSNTEYIVSNTTIRAASFNVPDVNSTLVFVGYRNDIAFSTPPTNPGTFTEDVDDTDPASTKGICFSHYLWSSSGATGDIDATSSSSGTTKHGFCIAFQQPITYADTPPAFSMSLTLNVFAEKAVDGPVSPFQLMLSLNNTVGERTPASFTGRIRGFRLFDQFALAERDHNNYDA